MTKMKVLALAVLGLGILLVPVSESQSISRQQRELKMGDQAVLASLAVARSPAGKKLCTENKLACVGPDKAELGLILIGLRGTKESRSTLIDLLAYRLDGSVAEDHRCYVFKAGPAIKRELLAARPDKLRDRCISELQKLTRSRSSSFVGLNVDDVCADLDSIREKIKELMEGANRGIKCSAEDF